MLILRVVSACHNWNYTQKTILINIYTDHLPVVNALICLTARYQTLTAKEKFALLH